MNWMGKYLQLFGSQLAGSTFQCTAGSYMLNIILHPLSPTVLVQGIHTSLL